MPWSRTCVSLDHTGHSSTPSLFGVPVSVQIRWAASRTQHSVGWHSHAQGPSPHYPSGGPLGAVGCGVLGRPPGSRAWEKRVHLGTHTLPVGLSSSFLGSWLFSIRQDSIAFQGCSISSLGPSETRLQRFLPLSVHCHPSLPRTVLMGLPAHRLPVYC